MDVLIVAIGIAVVAAAVATAASLRRRLRLAEIEAARLRKAMIATMNSARQDHVTGLLNRRGFVELGSAVLGDPAQQSLVLVLVCIDKVSPVSEAITRSIGDDVLVALGRRFADYSTGRVVAYLGGNTFAALITSAITPDGMHYPHAGELTQILAEPVWTSGNLVRATALVGVANADESAGLSAVMRRAEANMERSAREEVFHAVRFAEPEPSPAPRNDHAKLPPIFYRSRAVARHFRRSGSAKPRRD